MSQCPIIADNWLQMGHWVLPRIKADALRTKHAVRPYYE